MVRGIGRRGGFLLVLAVVQAVIGWSNLIAPPATLHSLTVFRDIPQWVLATYWLVPAAVGFVAGLFERRVKWEGISFFLSYFTIFGWGFAYVASWWPFHELEIGTAFRTAAIYWSFAAMILLVSGWSENNTILADEAKIPTPRK